jgi:hypothetical protein
MITQYFTKETMMNPKTVWKAFIFQHAYEHRKYIFSCLCIVMHSAAIAAFRRCQKFSVESILQVALSRLKFNDSVYFWLLASGRWLLALRYLQVASGQWVLASCCWPLASGQKPEARSCILHQNIYTVENVSYHHETCITLYTSVPDRRLRKS